jgi:two-component system, LytTR family, sensor kinase
MKLRWRQHEMILVNIVAAVLLIHYLEQIHSTDIAQYAQPYINNQVSFDLYRNVVFPDLGMGILIYLVYMLLNLYSIPRLLKSEGMSTQRMQFSWSKVSFSPLAKKVFLKYSWFFFQAILIVIVLGSALNLAVYFKHQWLLDYPGFSIFFNKNTTRSQIELYGSYWVVLFLLSLYCLYLLIRERSMHFIEVSGTQRNFRVLITNQVTISILYYIALPVFTKSFNIIHEDSFFPSYYLMVPALFGMYMSNTYWLFPKTELHPFFSREIISRLLITAFLFSLPLLGIIHEGLPPAMVYALGFQLFIITPLTWLLYQQRRDKILQLRGSEKALVKSRTDLQFLRSQINPHFLFNVLNTLYGTALQENAERTAGGIQKLGDMMRFMLHENHLDFIDMSREIDYLKNYIALQKLRTQGASEIIIEDKINGEGCHHKIAPMLLIPLVENAFKHGISLHQKSWIRIDLECSEREIFFEVRNSMHVKQADDPEKERSGIGIRNVLERLKLIYPGKFTTEMNGDGKEFFIRLSIQPNSNTIK